MAARNAKRSISMILRNKRGLWTVYILLDVLKLLKIINTYQLEKIKSYTIKRIKIWSNKQTTKIYYSSCF